MLGSRSVLVAIPDTGQAKKRGPKPKKAAQDGADVDDEDAGALGLAADLPPIPAALVSCSHSCWAVPSNLSIGALLWLQTLYCINLMS